MTVIASGQLLALAAALAQAYPTAADAREFLASINESFEALTDDTQPHQTRIQDAVAALAAHGPVHILRLIRAALDDPQQTTNVSLHQVLGPIVQQTRWHLLDATGHVLRLGPFVNRSNLRNAIDKLFMARRVLKVIGSRGVRGRSWSCQLIERQAAIRGARYIHIDVREAPAAGRTSPLWLVTELHAKLFPEPAHPPSTLGVAENRLVEPLTEAWVPPADTILVVIDHSGDGNVASAVREYVAGLAIAVAKGQLDGLKLVLIDVPPEVDLSGYPLQTTEDMVGPLNSQHVRDFFVGAATALFPELTEDRVQGYVETAIALLQPKLPAGASEELAIAVQDALESMALT